MQHNFLHRLLPFVSFPFISWLREASLIGQTQSKADRSKTKSLAAHISAQFASHPLPALACAV
jgi:hypothetical protein